MLPTIHLCVLTQEGVWISKLALFDSHPGEPHSLSLLYTVFWLLFCKDINEFPRSKPALSQHSLTYINKICCSNCEIICIHNYSGFSHKLQSCPRKHIKIEIHYLCFIVQNGLLFYQAAMIKKNTLLKTRNLEYHTVARWWQIKIKNGAVIS